MVFTVMLDTLSLLAQTLIRWPSIKRPGVFVRMFVAHLHSFPSIHLCAVAVSSISTYLCCDHNSLQHSVLPVATDCIYSQANAFKHMIQPAVCNTSCQCSQNKMQVSVSAPSGFKSENSDCVFKSMTERYSCMYTDCSMCNSTECVSNCFKNSFLPLLA